MKKNPFTKTEEKAFNYLCKAYNEFVKLKITHPTHLSEFTFGIHQCQRVLSQRILQRDYPNVFYSSGNKIEIPKRPLLICAFCKPCEYKSGKDKKYCHYGIKQTGNKYYCRYKKVKVKSNDKIISKKHKR